MHARLRICRRGLLQAACLSGLGLSTRSSGRADEPTSIAEQLRGHNPKSVAFSCICPDRRLPPERLLIAFWKAFDEDKSNDHEKLHEQLPKKRRTGITQPALPHAKKWANDREIKIKYLGGTPTVRAKVQKHAEGWCKHVNLRLKFVEQGEANARIAFDPSAGSWSYIGTDNLAIPSALPTMNLSWLKDDSDETTFSSVVLHEFGHLLGLIHEHQSPAAGIKWKRDKVIEDCWDQMGWSEAQVDQQIIKPYTDIKTGQYSKFDPTSIMMYPIPASWTTDGFSSPWNTCLSATDMSFIEEQYPPGKNSKCDK